MATRSSILRGESSITASDPAAASQSTAVAPEGRAGTSDRLSGSVSGVPSQGDLTEAQETQAADPKEAGVAETGGVVSSNIAIED